MRRRNRWDVRPVGSTVDGGRVGQDGALPKTNLAAEKKRHESAMVALRKQYTRDIGSVKRKAAKLVEMAVDLKEAAEVRAANAEEELAALKATRSDLKDDCHGHAGPNAFFKRDKLQDGDRHADQASAESDLAGSSDPDLSRSDTNKEAPWVLV